MNTQNRCCYEFGSFRLDPAEHILFNDGQIVSLTPKAFDTLLILVENHGHLVEKDELLEKVWADSFVEEGNVAKHISMLRKVLSENGLKEPFIETIPKRGYRFVAQLTAIEVEDPQEFPVRVRTPQEVEDPDILKLPKSTTRRKGITVPILSVGIITVVAVLAVGGWYYLPSMFEGDRPAIETTQVSLSTGFEKVRGGVISPDGKLIAFNRLKQGEKPTLAIRRLATGETIDLVTDLQPHSGAMPSFSPDSQFIYLYLHEKNTNTLEKHSHPLYRIPVSGGPAEKLIDDLPSNVVVSPDGNQLAYIRYDEERTGGTVFVSDKDGKNQKAIYRVKGMLPGLNQALWSNDGERVLFWEGFWGETHSAKWINKNDKTETEAKEFEPILELIPQNWRGAHNLVSLKDGSGFLFLGWTKTAPRQIYHLRAVDGKITQITNFTHGAIFKFSVSDDGKTIALNRGGVLVGNMISYDPVTKKSRQIMNDNRTIVPWLGFSQMPDGRILFANKTGEGRSDIYSMNEDGGNETRLTSGAGFKVNPVATADGKYIVFRSNRSGAHNLWRIDADGSNPIRLTNYLQNELDGIRELECQNISIQITNNGKTVFFAQQPKPGKKSKLMKISINGGEAIELLPNSQTSDCRPRISPEGKKLAYLGYVFDSKTSQRKVATYIRSLKGDRVGELEKKINATDMGGLESNPRWTADGKALTYYKPKNQLWDIWKLDIETGKKTALTSFESEADNVQYYHWSNDGKKIFILRAGTPQRDVVLIKNRDISRKLY